MSKKGLFEALSNSSEEVYIFENNMKTGISRWSSNAERYFALPEEYKTNTEEVWMRKIHPQDRKDFADNVRGIFNGTRRNHCVQYRVENYKGKYVWVECNGSVVLDEDGSPMIFAGIIRRLDDHSKYDSITKQLTHHQFYHSELPGGDGYFLLLSIDEYRKIISDMGHHNGNRILIFMADTLMEEIPYDKYIYKFESDEFLVVIPGINETEVRKLFEKLKRSFSQSCSDHILRQDISFSGGAVPYKGGSIDKELLISMAEHSLDYAKSLTQGQLVFFSESIAREHRRKWLIKEKLIKSVNDGCRGFQLYFQPVIDKTDRKITSCEALLRWNNDELGEVPPSEFIPVLEETGEITKVGEWVMEEAIKYAKRWNDSYNNLHIGFNVSYIQLLQVDFCEKLISLVEKYGVSPDNLVIELTESCKVEEPENLARVFESLLDYGFSIALDDFGMEYSSLSLVRDIPVTIVKIDHSFVRTLKDEDNRKNKANLAIIKSIIQLCRELSIKVVVEGIENKEVESIIEALDVDKLQGYYYSKPVPAHEFEKLMEREDISNSINI